MEFRSCDPCMVLISTTHYFPAVFEKSVFRNNQNYFKRRNHTRVTLFLRQRTRHEMRFFEKQEDMII
jgi:hypothetical protein